MIIVLGFVIGFGYAMLKNQRKETRNMLKIIEYMTENNADEEKFNKVMKAFEK